MIYLSSLFWFVVLFLLFLCPKGWEQKDFYFSILPLHRKYTFTSSLIYVLANHTFFWQKKNQEKLSNKKRGLNLAPSFYLYFNLTLKKKSICWNTKIFSFIYYPRVRSLEHKNLMNHQIIVCSNFEI